MYALDPDLHEALEALRRIFGAVEVLEVSRRQTIGRYVQGELSSDDGTDDQGNGPE